MNQDKKKVFVGISGGVDSSVSLALLKEKGYDVTGVFIKVWYPDWISEGCDWRSERRDAMRVCAQVGVPFLTLDLEKVYKEEVVNYLVETYKKGETPNPDVMCNRHVKFGAFWDFAKKHGADFIATGHYAQKQVLDNGYHVLSTAKDSDKDQTYFLWTLTSKDLEHILFPVGHLQKKEVRKIAEKFGLSTSQKKDSQGLCFLGDVTVRDLLSHYVRTEKGSVRNTVGDVIGEHDGALFYTIGQRHGFILHNKETLSVPHYVIEKNIDQNTITVDTKATLGKRVSTILLGKINWSPTEKECLCDARIRYRGKLLSCKVDMTHKKVIFDTDISQEFPAVGQSIVFYKDSLCLGGGIVESIHE